MNLYLAAGAFVLGVLVGGAAVDTVADARAARLLAERAEAGRAALSALDAERRTAIESLENNRAALLSAQDAQNDQIENLRRAVDAGDRRLRVRARCPAVSRTDADAGRAEDVTAELDSSARSDYFTLRRGLIQTESLLALCAGELRRRSR